MGVFREIQYLTLAACILAAAGGEKPAIAGTADTVPREDISEVRKPMRPVSTYSIVARDPRSGELGVAVQSHWFSVGSLVPWAKSGVGAVATQSFVEVSYGPLGLDMMQAGKTAPDALKSLLASDPHPDVRQVAMIDAMGNVAAHTGKNCIAAAGHRMGKNFSVQANLMLNDTVWAAMASAFERTSGSLADRMLAALEAAEGEGGDIRGRQSAAILVVRGKSTGRPWDDRVVDLRIEDHPDPIPELRRILHLHKAYERMNRGDELMADGEVDRALKEYAAAEEMAPESSEMIFWHAVTLTERGSVEEALPLFARAFEMDRNWRALVPRLVTAHLLPDDSDLLDRILNAGNRDR